MKLLPAIFQVTVVYVVQAIVLIFPVWDAYSLTLLIFFKSNIFFIDVLKYSFQPHLLHPPGNPELKKELVCGYVFLDSSSTGCP